MSPEMTGRLTCLHHHQTRTHAHKQCGPPGTVRGSSHDSIRSGAAHQSCQSDWQTQPSVHAEVSPGSTPLWTHGQQHVRVGRVHLSPPHPQNSRLTDQRGIHHGNNAQAKGDGVDRKECLRPVLCHATGSTSTAANACDYEGRRNCVPLRRWAQYQSRTSQRCKTLQTHNTECAHVHTQSPGGGRTEACGHSGRKCHRVRAGQQGRVRGFISRVLVALRLRH